MSARAPQVPIALTIAGSDPSGGAGIQGDLKTFTALGVYGASVITALTAQSTRGVTGIHGVPPQFVAQQIDAVAGDLAGIGPDVGLEVVMVEVDARVDDGHHDRRIAQGECPSTGRINPVGTREAPQFVEPRVGRQVGDADHGIRSCPLHGRRPAEHLEGGVEVAQGLDQVEPDTVE